MVIALRLKWKVQFTTEVIRRAKHRERHPSKYHTYKYAKTPRSDLALKFEDLPFARDFIEHEEENRRKEAWRLNKELFPRNAKYADEKETFFTNGSRS